MAALTVGIDVTHFFVYDVVMHLLMLHNLDPSHLLQHQRRFLDAGNRGTTLSGLFPIAVSAYALGMGTNLLICALARVGWFFLGHVVWLTTGFGIPVPEAAASHWFTWALGALAVEAAFGLVQLPKWCRNMWLGGLAIVVASAISMFLPYIQKDTLFHDLAGC